MNDTSSTNYLGPQYGASITKQEADIMFKKARDIEVANEGNLKNILGADPEADTYFTDPICGYLFCKQALQMILDQMTTDDHYMVLLRGAKEYSPGNINKGRKTVMALVYHASTPTTLQLDSMTMQSTSRTILQHPGTIKAVANYNMVPDTINVGDILE